MLFQILWEFFFSAAATATTIRGQCCKPQEFHDSRRAVSVLFICIYIAIWPLLLSFFPTHNSIFYSLRRIIWGKKQLSINSWKFANISIFWYGKKEESKMLSLTWRPSCFFFCNFFLFSCCYCRCVGMKCVSSDLTNRHMTCWAIKCGRTLSLFDMDPDWRRQSRFCLFFFSRECEHLKWFSLLLLWLLSSNWWTTTNWCAINIIILLFQITII